MKSKNKKNSKILIFKKYNLLHTIGGGAFGKVFLGTNIKTKEKVAIKIEERKRARTTLDREAFILYYLRGPGLPEVKSFGKTKKYNILVQTLLGRSLFDIFNNCNMKFTIKDICMIGLQILERLEYIHSKNYIHRDIKPHNFLVGAKNEGLIYIIDFGLAKKYRSDRGNHVKFTLTKHISGTPRFCSINAMRGVEQSRRDDLESLYYLIIFFFKGFLPWQGLKLVSRTQRFSEITKMKKYIPLEYLCEDLPTEIFDFCKYIKNLGFTDNPNYGYMKNLLITILNKNGFNNDKKFSWIKNTYGIDNDFKGELPIHNYHLHKNSPYKRLYKQIRNSLSKKRNEKKEKDENNDYTLYTIFIENNTNTGDISELNNIQKNNFIQSNDHNVLQNNLFQLNIDNYGHSYNYPIVVYKNNITDNGEQNNFNKIAQTFKGNDDSNIQIKIPDKISIIDGTKSYISNLQISSNNQIMILSEYSKNHVSTSNKTVKIHDLIRQEEKDGGVIGKDYDFKENDFFKIDTPLYGSLFLENNESDSNDKVDELIQNHTKNENLSDKNNGLTNHNSNDDINNNFNKNNNYTKVDLKINFLNKSKELKNEKFKSIELNNNINNNNKSFHIENKVNKNNDILNNTQKNIPKLNTFFVKHANINLNENFEKSNELKENEQLITNYYTINSERNKYLFKEKKIFKIKILLIQIVLEKKIKALI